MKKPFPETLHFESSVEGLPEEPGVYWFFGSHSAPLYIGKSLSIRQRVRSHFSARHRDPREMRLFEQTSCFGYEVTSGDLGAQLLESKRIKQYSPLYNQRLRRHKKLCRMGAILGADGYLQLTFTSEPPPSCVFHTRRQAIQAVDNWIREEGLCRQVLGLEKGRGPCFQRQLKRCKGACVNLHPPEEFNLLLRNRMSEYSVFWPYEGILGIEEACHMQDQKTVYWVSNWSLISISQARVVPDFNQQQPDFDLDTCRILQRTVRQGNLFNAHYSRSVFEYRPTGTSIRVP